MALKEPLMFMTGSGTAGLSLRADVGESLLVKGIYVYSPTDEYVTVRIEKTTVGYFRVSQTSGNHLHFPRPLKKPRNLLDLCYELGIFKGYPVGEGETFYLGPFGSASARYSIVYEIWDAGDKKPEDPNGSKSKEYFFVNYGDTGADITAAGDFYYNTPLCPREFPAFPFGADVPAKTKILLHGICGKEVAVVNSTPALAIFTEYLKMVYERVILFDKLRNGIPFIGDVTRTTAGTYVGGGFSAVGNYDHIDERFPLIFPEPIEFEAGEEVNLYVTVQRPVAGSSITRANQVIGLIETVIRE